MINLFFAGILMVFIILSYRKLLWGLGMIIVLLPSYLWRFNILGLPTTFLELMIVIIFLFWLIKEKRYKKINFSFQKNNINKVAPTLIILLGLWFLASLVALLSNFNWNTLGLWRAYFLEPLMFFLVFIYTVKDQKDWRVIINSLGLLLAWLFTVAMYQNFTDWNYIGAYNFPNVRRLTGPFAYPNALSLLTAPLAAFFFGLWLYSKEKLFNWYYLLLFIFGTSLAIMTVSQGAVVAIVFSLFLALILAKRWYKYGLAILLVLALGFLLITSTLDFNPSLNLQSSSLDIRFNQWQETMRLLGDNFFLGAGLNGYQKALVYYHQNNWLEIYLYPHNIFLNFWTEMGILGLIIFMSLIIYILYLLKKIFKAKNYLALALTMLWSTWLIHGLVDVPYFKNDLSVLFFMMLGLTFLVANNKKDVQT